MAEEVGGINYDWQREQEAGLNGCPLYTATDCGGGGVVEEEEEEEEDLFVFNDTIEGPRAPAVKPGRVTQA